MTEIEILNRRISETEDRLLSRLLLSAEQVLSSENYSLILEKFKENESLDLLEIERQITISAKEDSDAVVDIATASKLYRDDKKRFDKAESDMSISEENIDVEQKYSKMIISRENLFSIIDSHRIQENFKKQIF